MPDSVLDIELHLKTGFFCEHPNCRIPSGKPPHLCTDKLNGCNCWALWHNPEVHIAGIDDTITMIAIEDSDW